MTIKHLVISGGGPIMVQILSAVQELEKNNFINMNEIDSVYGTSAGAIMGVIFSLKFDWETINDYIIKRPWHDVFPIKVQNILDSYTKKGIFDTKTIEKCFKPLFDAKDIPLDINLKDFYELTKVELHLFAFEVNNYKVEDISHITYPELSLMKAVQMSCAIPILVTPVCIGDKCFMDGGVGCNYPLSFCIDSGKNPDEVLGFKNKYSEDKSNIDEQSTLLDYILNFLFKAIFNINNNCINPNIKNEIECDIDYLTFDFLKSSLSSSDVRRELFEKGKQTAIKYLNNINNINNINTNSLQNSI